MDGFAESANPKYSILFIRTSKRRLSEPHQNFLADFDPQPRNTQRPNSTPTTPESHYTAPIILYNAGQGSRQAVGRCVW